MHVGINQAGFLLLAGSVIFLCCLFRSLGKDRFRFLVVIGLTLVIPLYGCTASQVMVASYEDKNAGCPGLNNELGLAQVRLQQLEATDTTKRDVLNVIIGAAGFVIPPLIIINAALFFTESYAADYAEKKALKNRYNNMVMISQRQGCSSTYALIPNEEESHEPNA